MFADITMAISYSYVTAILLNYVLRGGIVTADKLFAGICIYIFIGLIWARAYHAAELATPDSFNGISEEATTAHDDLTYFSFVTLTDPWLRRHYSQNPPKPAASPSSNPSSASSTSPS